jgi:hypothetical protein
LPGSRSNKLPRNRKSVEELWHWLERAIQCRAR